MAFAVSRQPFHLHAVHIMENKKPMLYKADLDVLYISTSKCNCRNIPSNSEFYEKRSYTLFANAAYQNIWGSLCCGSVNKWKGNESNCPKIFPKLHYHTNSSIDVVTGWAVLQSLFEDRVPSFIACYKGKTTGNFFTCSLLLSSIVGWQIQIFKFKSLINFKWDFQIYCIFFLVCFVLQIEHFPTLLLEYSVINMQRNIEDLIQK